MQTAQGLPEVAADQQVSPRLVELVGAGLPFREVLEFTERALTVAPGATVRLAGVMRAFGHSIALDDGDPLSLALLPILKPEVIKLDMSLVRNPQFRQIDQVAAVAEVARNLLLRHPYDFPPRGGTTERVR